MTEFKSLLGPSFEAFIRYRKACRNWNESSYLPNLRFFDKFCYEKYPNESSITDEMADKWCAKRSTESNNSCISRIYVVLEYIRFCNSRTDTNTKIPGIPKAEKRTYIPHEFTQKELERFFEACDNYKPFHHNTTREKNCKYTLPVIFRLLYSTGMRTVEARLLERKNVDLTNGVICIENTKGYEQHYVAMHKSMTDLMKKYDCKMQDLYPNRKYFFCSDNDAPRSRDMIMYFFRRMWDSVNDTHATAYEFRHNYAIININKWLNSGFEFGDMLLYLSKSMGHVSVEQTVKYYYSIVPSLSDVLLDNTESGFNKIVPEVPNDDNK